MASSVTIPDPNTEGCYSSFLETEIETMMNQRIRGRMPDPVVDANNAGKLLFTIWDQASLFYIPCPPHLSTLDLCNRHVRRYPDLVPRLAAVHENSAYAWLCEQPTTITTTPKPPFSSGHCSFRHTPPKPREELEAVIASFLSDHRPRMRELVEKANHVPSLLQSWEPDDSVDRGLANHISGLRIPLVSDKPSLLLHGLGEGREDMDKDRIARIFSFAKHTVLINTPGSGKTWLILEALCRVWGFYYVGMLDSAEIGSSDFRESMAELDHVHDYSRARAENEADPGARAAIEHVREAAEHRLAQLLLARFLLMGLLIQEARKLPGGLQEMEHRRLWVLLQVQPRIFSTRTDIFLNLTRLLQHAGIQDLKQLINKQYLELDDVLKIVRNPATNAEMTPPFFCVLDEAQVTTRLRHGEFMSDDNSTKRPILWEIWRSWTTILLPWQMRLVLSGTSIDLQDLTDTFSSSALMNQPYDVKSDIGAFEDRGSQAKYIQRYVPACWTDPRWAEFLNRAWGWLRGRYCSTAVLVLLILEGGYSCPHRTLDGYVEAFTGFKPTDGKYWTDRDPELPPDFNFQTRIIKLKLGKMNDMQMSTIYNAIYDQVLYGSYSLSSFTSEERATFIEYGFARHRRGIQETVLDEPLAILAALSWLNRGASFSLFECLRRNLETNSKRKNGFEAYLAFHLRKVFEASPELDTIFTFRSDFALRGSTDLPWQHEKFQLVTVAAANSNNPSVSVVTPSCGPSSNVGLLARSGEEVLEWISTNTDQFTFCFPPEAFGPDLLFFVRSAVSGRLLLVVVQAKKCDIVEKAVLLHGVRTVTPSWFWKSKDKKHRTAEAAPFITNEYTTLGVPTSRVLANIPLGIKADDVEYPVLRVFASWQGEVKLERTVEWREENPERGEQEWNVDDPDRHPLATLHLDNFKEVGEKLDQNWFRGDLEQKLVVHSKRPREHDPQSLRDAKRARLERLPAHR